MKKIFTMLLCGFLMAASVSVHAADSVKLIINGVDVTDDMEVKPQLVDGEIMVPAKLLAEALGATVGFDEETNTFTVTSPAEPEPQGRRKTDITATPGANSEIVYTKAEAWENSIGTAWVYGIAEILNTGDKPLYLSSGSFDYEDESGKLIEASTLISVYPEVILPGESAFYFEATTLDKKIDVEKSISVLPAPSVKEAKVEQILLPITDFEVFEDNYGRLKASGRVENTTDEKQSTVYIAAVLRDKEDNPIAVLSTLVTSLEPGQKIGFEASALGLPPSVTLESIEDVEVFAYPWQLQL